VFACDLGFEVTGPQNIGGEMGISIETTISRIRDQVRQLKTMPPSIAIATANELCNKIEMIADEIFARQAVLMLQLDAIRQRTSQAEDDYRAVIGQTCLNSEMLCKTPIPKRIGARLERVSKENVATPF